MSGAALFRLSAACALALHAILLLASDGLHGGADMKPHLRLIELMGENPGLHNVYPPFYHALGALFEPITGNAAFPEWFSWWSAAGLILAFRFFQRATRLPDACATLFAWMPYMFALTLCLPKIEVAGYALALIALGLLATRKYPSAALVLAGTFFVHTGAALFLGLCGGVLALASRDYRALLALAAGTLLATPLLIAHLASGCSIPQALLFSPGDYLRAAPRSHNLLQLDRIAVLANPIVMAASIWGVAPLWRLHRPLAIMCVAITLLYLNEIWLAPFGARSTLDLLRGLTIFALPVTIAAGLHLESRPAVLRAVTAASVVLAVATSLWVVPAVCVSKPIDVDAVGAFDVDRCAFRWRLRADGSARHGRGKIGADRGVERTADLERAAQ